MRKLITILPALFFSLVLFGQQEKAQPLSGNVNSGYNEWAPLFSPGGDQLYFSRLGHPQNMGDADEGDIWISLRDGDGLWARAVNAGAPLNSREAEFAIGIHASGRRLYLFKPASGTVLYSDREGRAWRSPKPMAIDSFRPPGGELFAHVSFDGQALLLSAAGPESLGGTDAYISFARSGQHFGRPRHLGPAVNSAFDEQSLFLAADGKTLYFSSNRPGGFGGQDLYMCRRLDDSWLNWSPPVNLGAAVNTNANERFLALPASGKPACFLRDNPEGFTDIFEAILPDSLLPEPVALVSGKVKDAKTGMLLEAEVQLQPALASDGSPTGVLPAQEGHFQLILPLEEDASLLAVRKGYFPVSQPLELSGRPLEELDRDQPTLLASTGKDMEYLQRNEEIERLQLHLRRLDDELIALRQEREAARQAIIEKRKQDAGYQPLSDPELDALRHRYSTYLQAQPDTLRPEVPQSYSQEEQQELQDMKERYERYTRYQKEQLARRGGEESSSYLWDEAKGFESLQEEVQQQLEESLAPKVGQELSAGMYEEVKREVARSLRPEEREQLELKEEELRNNIREGFTPSASASQWAKKSGAPETEWERKLREGLKSAMEPRVREQLREGLRDDIRAALQNDLAYWAKKETKDKLQGELNQKLQQQIEQEKRRAAQSTLLEEEAVAPLQPPLTTPREYREVSQELLLAPAKPGQSIPLNTVIFEPNSPTLKPLAYAELARVRDFLEQNEQLMVEIGVHAAGKLSHTTALSLTIQRAKAIANYLAGNGIAENRIVPKGYGKAFPIADNRTVEGQRLNQRVEMRIIGIE